VLREDGRLIATTSVDAPTRVCVKDPAEKSKEYVRRHWTYREPKNEPGNLLERAQSHTLCISGMAFQDAWNIDLQRLKRCCIHVVTPQSTMVPFCAYYMTSSSGRRLVLDG
jgi:7,8-dihydro-6-hydroxymethylpterin dimethyltransferase